MNISRWLGIVGGVLLCVSAFTPLRTSTVAQMYFTAINDLMIVDNGGWLLIGAGVLAIVAGLLSRSDALIVAGAVSAGAAAFVAGSMRATYVQLGIYGNEYAKSEAISLIVPSWGWLLVVGGVVLVTAAAILAKVPRNSSVALKPAQQTGD